MTNMPSSVWGKHQGPSGCRVSLDFPVSGRPPKAVVLLSGGLDSAVAAACIRDEGFAIHALSIDYGQRHRHELDAAGRVARSLGAADQRTIAIDLRAIGGSALTDDLDVPKDAPAGSRRTGGIPVTYVPARNLVFLSIAAGYAETIGASDLCIGVNAVDYSGYPDCRPAFIEAFERAVNLGTKAGTQGRALRVRTPLIDLSKADIIRQGMRRGVDLSLTHSCYDPGPDGSPCGRCDSCAIRRQGFAEAGVPDPARPREAEATP
jgi:7-cyano-7-deazaguanine synthase